MLLIEALRKHASERQIAIRGMTDWHRNLTNEKKLAYYAAHHSIRSVDVVFDAVKPYSKLWTIHHYSDRMPTLACDNLSECFLVLIFELGVSPNDDRWFAGERWPF